MGADDLLCSRNARHQKALVGRAQWKINQPPSLKRERASLEDQLDLLCPSDARNKGQPRPLPLRKSMRNRRGLVGRAHVRDKPHRSGASRSMPHTSFLGEGVEPGPA
jgi:hypothetical protein